MATIKVKNTIKSNYMAIIAKALTENGEEVMQVKSGTIAFPIVYEDGEEGAVTVTISIPSGSRDGDAYDPYEEAQNYKVEMEQKAEKAKAAAEAKAKKMERDAKRRADAAAKKAKRLESEG